jgi:hypothetical protein
LTHVSLHNAGDTIREPVIPKIASSNGNCSTEHPGHILFSHINKDKDTDTDTESDGVRAHTKAFALAFARSEGAHESNGES